MAYQKDSNWVNTPKAPDSATATDETGEIVEANASRRGLQIRNLSEDTIVYLALGHAAVVGKGMPLKPGDVWCMGTYDFTEVAVNAIVATGTADLAIQEFN